MSNVNLTPDPRILATIAQNPMKPLDALSELIDNSLDGFATAEDPGFRIANPTVDIRIPSMADVEKGIGVLSVTDNGTGLTERQAVSAVTAGFSGQDNPIDRLGLFGMGFNISTAKLGKVTRFKTCQRSERKAYSITIDIDTMTKSRSFEAPIEYPPYEEEQAGTTVEVMNWWPHGHQNYGFIQELAKYNKAKLKSQLGRRYSALIEKGYVIKINGDECPIYRHCAWSAERFITHQKYGKIPAKIYIDEDLGQEIRCKACWVLLETAEISECQNCHAQYPARVLNKKIKGWVGIQRFDDQSKYGIDLLRNGRVIRDSEKDAFFTFRSEDGEEIKDYPIDSQYGRIIGSLEINHVPVNYLKTDFDRTSTYWQEVMEFLRGTTSLQPTLADGKNDSPIFKLFQGYRKVRDAGTKDLYMGFFNMQSNKPSRISRDIEKEYYKRFLNDEPGYGHDDDTEWYKLVIDAERRPVEDMKECPNGHENAVEVERCLICSYLFKSKKCIKGECHRDIAQSSLKCEYCGALQAEGEDEYWKCNICNHRNSPDLLNCVNCGSAVGAKDPFDEEVLLENSSESDELSLSQLVQLPEQVTDRIDVKVYLTKPNFTLTRGGVRVPIIVKYGASGKISMYVDQSHPAYVQYRDRHEDYIAMELALFIKNENTRLSNTNNKETWSLSNLYFNIHDQAYRDRTRLDHNQLITNIGRFFNDIRDRLPHLLGDMREDVLNSLDDNEKGLIFTQASSSGQDPSMLFVGTRFMSYISDDGIVKLVQDYPTSFFDNRLWSSKYHLIEGVGEELKEKIQKDRLDIYVSSLQDIARYKKMQQAPENSDITNKAFYSLSTIQSDFR